MSEPDSVRAAQEEEPAEYYLLSKGWLVDFLMRLSVPVVAWPGRSIFRVRLHGHGISLPIEGRPPTIGFYTTHFAAAKNVRSAERAAIEEVILRWETFCPEATGQLLVEVEDTEELTNMFRFSSHTGFSFYGSNEA